MILVADVGNTNIKIGILDENNTVDITRIPSSKPLEVEEYEGRIAEFLKRNNLSSKDINSAVISSVVPSVTGNLKEAFAKSITKNIVEVNADTDIGVGISSAIPNKRQIGADRLVNVCAGYNLYGGPCVVVDLGSAITFDIISQQGEFIGGVIAPGIDMSNKALRQFTALLPMVEKKAPKSVIATDTESNMQAGLVLYTARAIEGIIDDIEAELGQKVKTVLTGGDAEMIFNVMKKHKDYLNNEINFDGMRMISKRNRPKI